MALLALGIRLALRAPAAVAGPEISLSFTALPWYALLSTGRMAAAYGLSLLFSLFYGYAAARNRTAERVLNPLLDVLQSVPILSFLPVVLLGLTAVLPEGLAAELSAIALIFVTMAFPLAYSFYQSMKTISAELREAAAVFRLGPWLRLKSLELPFAAVGLIWNSMMSWSAGWFYLIGLEIFTVGARDFRRPGLGSYLQTAADAGNWGAVLAGLVTLVGVILLLDQLVWRPFLAWADRFKLETVAGDQPTGSWFYQMLSRAWLLEQFGLHVWTPFAEWVDDGLQRRWPAHGESLEQAKTRTRLSLAVLLIALAIGLAMLYGAYQAVMLLHVLTAGQWLQLGLGMLATLARVAAAVVLSALWTIPVGVAIGTNRRVAAVLQPIVQVAASFPATALFPVVLIFLLRLPGGLSLAAVVLILLGTQWYLLFNIIAGAAAIPQDLRYTTDMLRLSRWDRWRNLILPALFPYLVTGGITAGGGAWSACIVAEYVQLGGQARATTGIGALIAQATANGNYAQLLAGTLALILTVVVINLAFWRRLYRTAESKYRLE